MTIHARPVMYVVLALAGVVGLATVPAACTPGGVGDPCTPEDEFDPAFSGFQVNEGYIESRSFQCETRICLVNHFQGRTSCPLGQPARAECDPEAANPCGGEGESCVAAGDTFVCHKPGCCQTPENPNPDETCPTRGCCVPGTDTPVVASVCGQCESADTAEISKRNADNAVYCSCRCGPPTGKESDDDPFDYCECPDGFECQEIRPDIGISDELLAGKYCIKKDTFTTPAAAATECQAVRGYSSSAECEGLPIN